MGTPFRWLVGSSWTTNLGDGLAVAAGPLLIAAQTQDPALVALAALLQRLPWLLFGLYAGALADRVDRRRLVILVDTLRAVILTVLVTVLVTGTVNVPVVLGATFLLGVAEVFADTTSATLLPMVVPRTGLGIGNARLMAGMITGNQLVGPALGAVLFAAGAALPFAVQAVCVAVGAGLISRMSLRPLPRPDRPPHLRRDVAGGLRWTWGNPAVRTLTLAIVTFNVTYGAAWSVLVLYAGERLGLGPVGYGALVTVGAVGGLVGTASYDRLERVVSLAALMRVGLVRNLHPPRAGADHHTLGRVGGHVRLRHARLRLGDDVTHGADARRPARTAGPGRQPVLDRRLRRDRGRPGGRRRHRQCLGRHRAVLVRLRRLGADPGADLASAGPHRP
jgi:hypothetical protein